VQSVNTSCIRQNILCVKHIYTHTLQHTYLYVYIRVLQCGCAIGQHLGYTPEYFMCETYLYTHTTTHILIRIYTCIAVWMCNRSTPRVYARISYVRNISIHTHYNTHTYTYIYVYCSVDVQVLNTSGIRRIVLIYETYVYTHTLLHTHIYVYIRVLQCDVCCSVTCVAV